MMWRPRRSERFLAGIVVSLLAFGLTGVAFAGISHQVSAAKVRVTFTDTTLRVSAASFESGTTTFVVLNMGKKRHVLEITGPGLRDMRTAKLAAGSSATLTVRLRPGAYVLSDPVGLGVYDVQFLNVVRAVVVSGNGRSNVVNPPVDVPPMCGTYLTP